MCGRLGIDWKMSTAFHPQTDGQTEQMNASMEHYLRVLVNHQQDDWVKWLPLVECAAKNGTSKTMKCTPFYAVHDVDPRMTFAGEPMQERDPRRIDTDQVQATMQQIHDHLRVEVRRSQAVQEEGGNCGRIPSPNIREGSRALLGAQNIRTIRPACKLEWKRLGPFMVVRRISPYAYELELPASLRIHRV